MPQVASELLQRDERSRWANTDHSLHEAIGRRLACRVVKIVAAGVRKRAQIRQRKLRSTFFEVAAKTNSTRLGVANPKGRRRRDHETGRRALMHPPHAADAPSDIHRLNRTRLLPSSVFHSWFNDECPDDESGKDNDGQRYKKGFHGPELRASIRFFRPAAGATRRGRWRRT